ncbi:MerR family transcriptional regulator [Salegentibacter chungangensis]|uniref:MerR family transcriptional regulator n=1 Tax=Salegentibacter chungangensis TaxID=1335724 RepID=A0ABW3NW70_9FLAO
MEYIKQTFSIKDLENLSGIKAHTIRIWEKRYNILSPDRTSTNIRTYDISSLQKILNIAFLNESGYKISRISKLSDEEISDMVRGVNTSSSEETRAITSLKLAMLNFDEALFSKTYNELKKRKSFTEIFLEVFLPLLEEIGVLWQTDTIKPIHEHYIVDLIKQKVYLNIGLLKEEKEMNGDTLFVLFLPDNEIHDVGILYLYYELLNHNRSAIYLGPSLPLSDMNYLLELHDNVAFISYLTTQPEDMDKYLQEFNDELSEDKIREFYLFGKKAREIDKSTLSPNIKAFNSLVPFIKSL